jgi:cell division protein FtsW
LGPVSFQPAELAKLALVIYLAAYLARRQDGLASFSRGLLPPLGIAGGLAVLVLAQPDLGSCLTLIMVTFGLLFLAGARTQHLGLLVALALPVLVFVVRLAPYRLRRITTFVDPWADPRGGGFQIIQSWLALGGGGLFGRGIGESKQKLFYLPESHTDFIFAVMGEELGFAGAVVLLALFVVLIWRGLRVGVRAPDAFGAYLALGITVLIATQTFVNLGVVTGSLPTKGLPLPCISFGGSSLLVTMLSAGVLLNISQHANV